MNSEILEYGSALIRKTFKLEETHRNPWVPFMGCHGASLIGVTADEYLHSSVNLVKGVSLGIELYKPDGIPIIFDLQIEAEVLGCNISWSKENPPSVISHPLQNGTALEDLTLPKIDQGRIPIIVETTKILREKFPDIALYGLITGPFTLSLHLLGTDIFLKIYEDPDYVNKIIEFCSLVSIQMAKIYLDNGCDVIALVDPMTSQIDPESFRQFVKEPIIKIFEYIRKRDALSSFFVCGNAHHNIELMCNCKPDNISIDENIPLDYVKEMSFKHKVSFGGNLKLTSILLLGSADDCKNHAVETIDIGGKKGFVLSPGCDLPMSTPVENLKAVSEIINDEYQQEIIRNIEKADRDLELIDLSGHFNKEKVTIDIITIDSSSCAPCQYMLEAVQRVAQIFKDKVEYHEHKIKSHLGIRMMTTLGVKSIPTICVDGKIEFSSRIPSSSELEGVIKIHLDAKDV